MMSATKKRTKKTARRCRATTFTIDGPVPYTERCVLLARHDDLHECNHGFHFERDERRPVGEAWDASPWSASTVAKKTEVAAIAAKKIATKKTKAVS